jgi:hypothetical protein
LRCKCCSGYFLSRALFDRHVNLSEDSWKMCSTSITLEINRYKLLIHWTESQKYGQHKNNGDPPDISCIYSAFSRLQNKSFLSCDNSSVLENCIIGRYPL